MKKVQLPVFQSVSVLLQPFQALYLEAWSWYRPPLLHLFILQQKFPKVFPVIFIISSDETQARAVTHDPSDFETRVFGHSELQC